LPEHQQIPIDIANRVVAHVVLPVVDPFDNLDAIPAMKLEQFIRVAQGKVGRSRFAGASACKKT
jgi:hypothetical protein